ncbi:MAG: hypothetical protein ABFC71_08795 [Methanoregula sp.]
MPKKPLWLQLRIAYKYATKEEQNKIKEITASILTREGVPTDCPISVVDEANPDPNCGKTRACLWACLNSCQTSCKTGGCLSSYHWIGPDEKKKSNKKM